MITEEQAGVFVSENPEASLQDLLLKATELQQRDPEEALILISEIAEQAKLHKLPSYLAAAQKVKGNVHFLRGATSEAKACYLAALAQARKVENPKLKGDINYNLGRVFTREKDYPTALKYLHKSLTYRSRLDGRTDEISSLSHIGQVFWELQDFQQAVDWYQRAARTCDSTVSDRLTSSIYNNLGNAYIKTNEISLAMEAYIRSLNLKEAWGKAADLATAKLNLGNLYYTNEDYPTALGYYQDAQRLYQEAGDLAREAIVLSNLGATFSELKDLDQAELYHTKALEYFRQNGMRENQAKSLNNIGTIYHLKAQYRKAVDIYRESLEIKSDFYNPESLAITYNNLSECHYNLEDYVSALESTQTSMSYANQIKSKALLLKNYLMLGKIYAALEDYQNAYEALNVHRLLDLEVYAEGRESLLADKMVQYDTAGKSRQIDVLNSDRQALMELVEKQVKDKIRYLKLYRAKLDGVKRRKTIQAKLKKLNAELEQRIRQALQDYQTQQQIIVQKSKLESLGVMAAGMAHEINQPLSAISMGINNLRIKAQKHELSDEYLRDKILKLSDDIQRIKNVIEHVRQFSRDQINNHPERIDIHQTLKDATALLAHDLAKHQITLKLRLTDSTLTSVGSRFKLEQVFVNLITNARDAIMDKRQIDARDSQAALIRISSSRQENHAEIEIWDNGTGISESCLGRVFDPFYTTKSPERGTGLGLSICYGIITEMGGKIMVSSELGLFTGIMVSLPILEEQR